jgi:hypothetical protein
VALVRVDARQCPICVMSVKAPLLF